MLRKDQHIVVTRERVQNLGNHEDRERVWHYLYGEGTIVESRHRGLQLIAQFRDGIKRVVRGKTSKILENRNNGHKDQETTITHCGKMVWCKNSYHRSIIEALRLGIVPYGAVRNFTFGRDMKC